MALSNKAKKHRPAALAMAAVLGATITMAPLRDARADEVSAGGKGIVGGALLGVEVPVIIEGIAGVRSGWVYLVSAVVGGGGGAVGGYFIDKGSSDGKAPMYMLAGGLALVIPALVLTLNGTRYQPEEGATEDRAPVGPAAEPGAPGGSSIAPGVAPAPVVAPPAPPPPAVAPAPPPPPPPQSLLDVHQGTFRVGVPVPDVRPMFSVSEMRSFGMKDNPAAFHMPVLRVVF
jgi:hypothetical protein